MLAKALTRQLKRNQSRLFSKYQHADETGKQVARIGEDFSKHRMLLPLYDIAPKTENNWVAPSATVIGEVDLRRFASVWYNAVVRGDINRVTIGSFSSVGERSVLATAPSLPTGMPARLTIGSNTSIGAGCSLYSC